MKSAVAKVKEISNHISTVTSLLVTLRASNRMHALIVEGPAGWGKTTAVDEALKRAGVQGVYLGAYSTPLNLFNFLHENSDGFVIIDDCAGLFNDQSSMAILKAATWAQGNSRTIRWGSTSSKAATDQFTFRGKLVIVCNSFPMTADADAVRSRSFPCKVEISLACAKELLMAAALDKNWHSDSKRAQNVAKFICSRLSEGTLSQISYRTLQMGYELAEHNEGNWQELLGNMIVTMPENPKKLIRQLAKQDLKVKDQCRIFEETTGLKRRTFFKYRRDLNMSR